MTRYALYVESGPRRRKTQVHVLDLLGCIAQGLTTEAALGATPEAIRTYLRFLKRHGEAVNPDVPFTTAVAIHVTEGTWLGEGDPDPGFAPDFQPLTTGDLDAYLRRLAWMQADLLQMVSGLSLAQLDAAPASGGRTIRAILQHVAGAHYAYLQSPLGKPEGLSAALRLVEEGSDIISALTELWRLATARLQAMTPEERTQMVKHGARIWSARRALRRMLEHNWEHLMEISARLNKRVG